MPQGVALCMAKAVMRVRGDGLPDPARTHSWR
jgi:hypothetical protein